MKQPLKKREKTRQINGLKQLMRKGGRNSAFFTKKAKIRM
nr:MAG TPA: hypothetical protein [Microviridae sp.]